MALTVAPRGNSLARQAQYGVTTYQVGDQMTLTDGAGASYLARIERFQYSETGAGQDIGTVTYIIARIEIPVNPTFAGATLVKN